MSNTKLCTMIYKVILKQNPILVAFWLVRTKTLINMEKPPFMACLSGHVRLGHSISAQNIHLIFKVKVVAVICNLNV